MFYVVIIVLFTIKNVVNHSWAFMLKEHFKRTSDYNS